MRVLTAFSLAIATLAALPAAPVFAQGADKQSPPAPGSPKAFTLPVADTFTLSNGLGVTLVPYGTVPKATVYLAVDAGNVDEAANQVWLADLTGAFLKEGTTTASAAEVAERLARAGGSLDVSVRPDVSSISTDVLSEFAADAVAVIADIVQRPAWPESELARLKADLVRNLSVARSTPGAQAQELFAKALFGDHPYGRVFPTEASLNALTLADAKAFHAAHFGAGRSHLYVVGRFDADAVRAAVRRSFEGWGRGTPVRREPPTLSTRKALHVADRPNAPQSTLYVGLPVIDPSHEDYVVLRVTNALLGGSFGSRITRNLREQKGYTYSPTSQLAAHPKATYWAEIADVTTAATGASLTEINLEIERLRNEAPSEEEVLGITTYMSGLFVLQNSSRGGIIGQLEHVRQYGLGPDHLSTLVQRIRAVTPRDVHRIARQYIDPAKMTTVVVGDRAEIDAQLKP